MRRGLLTASEYFANVWSDAESDGQLVPRAIAAGESLPNKPQAIRQLREHDVLNEMDPFAEPMMKDWLQKSN